MLVTLGSERVNLILHEFSNNIFHWRSCLGLSSDLA